VTDLGHFKAFRALFVKIVFIFFRICLRTARTPYRMVIKHRFRGFALPFMLYLVSGVAAVFFINEAGNGSRGIETRNGLLSEIARLSTELSKVTAERMALERRNALVSFFHVDAEFLEERSRVVLNRGNRNDVVIMTAN
jgi:cell division protein FtsB